MAQEVEFPCVTRHCLLHAVDVLAPNGIHHVLPKSGSHKIERFCEQLSELTKTKQQRKRGVSLPEPPLLQSIDVHRFYSGASSIGEFTMLVEEKLLTATEGDIDLDALQRLCWQYYEMDKRSVITFPKWLSPECTYRLWLIFNTVHDHNLVTSIPRETVNEVVKRLIELCGYTWNKTYQYTKQEEVEFPEYVEAITDYFDQLHLETSLTCEVIADLVDEVVNGVIKKGYLRKKGHKRRNVLRRWFVLQRTILRYYETRDAVKPKGQLVLNARTEVASIPDKGSKKFQFLVTCGHTGIPFQIRADDQRTKHEWILAIRKAIALAKIIEGKTTEKDDSFTESIAGFYLLKYGTEVPALSRQDSELKNMKYHTTVRQFQRLTDAGVGTREDMPRHHSLNSTSSEDEPLDEYCEMQPGVQNIDSDSSDSGDEEGYLDMQPNRLGRVDEEDEDDALAGLEYETPVKSPSGGESSLKGDTPVSPLEKPLIIIEPQSDGTPPPVVERPKSPLLYDKCNSGIRYAPRHNSDVDGSYIQISRKSIDSGWGSIDIELPPPVSENNGELSSNAQEKSADTLGIKRDLLQRPTPTSGAGYLTILPSKEGEQAPVPPRKAKANSPTSIQSPPRELSPPAVSPPGSRVSSRDSSFDVPPPPPPRVSPRHHRPLKLSTSGENPPPVPSRRAHPHRISSPPGAFGKRRSASESDLLEDALDDNDIFSKSVAIGPTWGGRSNPPIPTRARHQTDRFVK